MKTIDINALEALYVLCAKPENYFSKISVLKRRAERYNGIINSLSSATRPLRCKEIAESLPKMTIKFYDNTEQQYPLPWQSISAMLKNMRRDGIVERIQIGTEIIRGHIEVPIYGYRLAAVEG